MYRVFTSSIGLKFLILIIALSVPVRTVLILIVHNAIRAKLEEDRLRKATEAKKRAEIKAQQANEERGKRKEAQVSGYNCNVSIVLPLLWLGCLS